MDARAMVLEMNSAYRPPTNINTTFLASNTFIDDVRYSLFTQEQELGGETFDEGDLLIGDNAASNANVFWDASTQRLKFRYSTTVKSYIDTDGSFNYIAGAQSTDTAPLVFRVSEGGTVVGNVLVYYNAAGNVSSSILNNFATSSGDTSYASIQANHYNGKLTYMQITSQGEASVNLTDGASTGAGDQRFRVRAAHSGSNTSTEVMTIESERSSGATTAGFGSKLNFYADTSGGTMTYQGGIESKWNGGGTTNGVITIAADYRVNFYHGGGAPNVTGSRGGNAALADLLTELASLGLIADGSSA